MIRAVTLDATHTLIEPLDLVGAYAGVLARHGIEPGVEALGRAIVDAWAEISAASDPARDRFAHEPGGARAFWRRYLERVCALAGAERPSRFAAAELFDAFAHPELWRVYPDVLPALERLKGSGLRLAVVSNWDERLPALLERLDLARWFDAVVVSAAVGVEKPHPRIFAVALERLGLAADAVVHVGDRQLDDVEGAKGAGLAALRLDRRGDGDLASLDQLIERLAAIA
ncbi:MAG TPA: HAD-IA family hydrolase [Thermoanaerobaculia bacterium]|nr:HAD-IA family hydrolase [Thermoanaerobaculia bacterium]